MNNKKTIIKQLNKPIKYWMYVWKLWLNLCKPLRLRLTLDRLFLGTESGSQLSPLFIKRGIDLLKDTTIVCTATFCEHEL